MRKRILYASAYPFLPSGTAFTPSASCSRLKFFPISCATTPPKSSSSTSGGKSNSWSSTFVSAPRSGAFFMSACTRDKAAADFYADNIGLQRSPSARQESMELLLQEMEENGIDMGVATGRVGHRKGNVPNDEIIRLMKEYPGKFVGLAGIDASDPKEGVREMLRVCVDGPLKGVVLEPGALDRPRYVDDARLYPFYAECERRRIPVILMIGGRAGPRQNLLRSAASEQNRLRFSGGQLRRRPRLLALCAGNTRHLLLSEKHLRLPRSLLLPPPRAGRLHPGWQLLHAGPHALRLRLSLHSALLRP